MSTPHQDDLTLDDLFKYVSTEKPKNPYEDFFLLSNPFPTLGQFNGICVDQESVKAEFTRVLRNFYLDSQSQIMTILGSTGAGKTNLLRFLEQTLINWREPRTDQKAIIRSVYGFRHSTSRELSRDTPPNHQSIRGNVYHRVLLSGPTA